MALFVRYDGHAARHTKRPRFRHCSVNSNPFNQHKTQQVSIGVSLRVIGLAV
jgi:hypothetical protein